MDERTFDWDSGAAAPHAPSLQADELARLLMASPELAAHVAALVQGAGSTGQRLMSVIPGLDPESGAVNALPARR